MAYETLTGAIANGDLSTSQFCFVQMSGSTTIDFEVGLTTAATQRTVGVLMNNPNTSGHPAEVAISGVCKLRFGGTVGQGAYIVSDTLGRGITESTGINDYKLAQALQNGTATGVYFVRLISPFREST